MARNKLSNTFLKLDTDTSQNKQDNTSFYDGQNLRLVSDEALTNGALVNFKGTKAKINLGNKYTKLKGYAEIGDDLALLLHRPVTGLVPDSPTIPIADTALSNYEVSTPLENTIFNNVEDVELNKPIISEFTDASDIGIGAIVRVEYSGGGSNLFKLRREFRYKIEFTATGIGTINPSIVIFNLQGIRNTKAKLKLNKSDVLLYREFTGTTTITESISFYYPYIENYYDDYYIAFYPNGFTEDSTYITNNFIDASVDITINNIWYNKGWDIDYISPQLKNRFIWNPPVSSTPVDISNDVFPYINDYDIERFKVTLRFSELSARNARIVMVDGSNIEVEASDIIACNEDDLHSAGFDLLDDDGNGDGYSYSLVNGASVGTTDITVSAVFLYHSVTITAGCKFVIKYESTESANITIDEQHVEYLNNYGGGAGEVNALTDVFTLIDSDYIESLPGNVSDIRYSPYTTEFYDILTPSYHSISLNFTGGYEYEIDLTAISDTHGSIKLGIGTSSDAPEKEEYVTSGIAHKLIVDLTQVTGDFYLILWSHLNETIDITISNMVSISPQDILLYTIPANDKIVFQFKGLTTAGGTSDYSIKIKDTAGIEVGTYSYLKETSNLTVHDIFFENQLGYKVYLRMCPDTLVKTEMLISDVREYLLDNNKTYPLNILQNNKACKVNISQDNILTPNGELATPYITYRVVNTRTQETLYTTQSNALGGIEFSFTTPNDTDVYRLYAGFNGFAALSVTLTDGIITYYTLSVENAYGNIIAKVTPDNTDVLQDITILYSDAYSKDSLAFDSVEQVQALGLYETNDSKKIYFAVPDKPLRLFNIAANDFSIAEATSLDILPNSVTSSINITDIIPGGNIPNGKIQYACRLFDKYGAETSFSSASELISLTQSNVGDDSFTGGDVEISSGKSTRIHVQLSKYNTFKYIRLYAIHYSTPDVPEIYLVGEKEITNNSAIFIDTGIKLDTITLEEFNAFGGRVFSAEVIEEKNNILFAANIKESQDVIAPEDLDCRAYRFDSTGWCKIWERDDITNPSYYTINPGGGWFFWKYDYTLNGYKRVDSGFNWSIPITADAINRYNDEFLKPSGSNVHPHLYDKQSDGDTIGGTGKIVSYEIKTSNGFTVVNDGKLNVTNANKDFILKSTSLKQGEVYRIGLVPYDLKGKPYFVHWVGDIRIPYVDTLQESIAHKTPIGDLQNIAYTNKNIYIEVSINKFNIPQDVINKISGFKLVYVERKDVDKSVIAQGYTNGSMLYSIELNGYGFNTFYTGSKDYSNAMSNYHYIHQFISPEFNINNGKTIEGADLRLHVNKIISKIYYKNSSGYTSYPVAQRPENIIYPITKEIQSGGTTNNTLQSVTGKRYDGDPSTITVKVGTSFDINNAVKTSLKTKDDSGGYTAVANNKNITIYNRVISNTLNTVSGDVEEATMFGPTGIVFTSNYALLVKNYSDEIGTQESWIYVLDLYRNNAVTRYGGDTHQARSVNSYISLSEFIPITEHSVTSFGDIYNSVFDILLSGKDFFDHPGINSNTIQTIGLYPIESSVNCFLTSIKPSTVNYSNLNESQTIGIETWGNEYPLIGNTNRYNSVYSVNSKYPLHYPKPLFFDELSTEPYTISHSQKKVRGEYTDSWAKFLYANSLEVSGKYGAIHGLTHYNNKLIFFQEDAVGTVAVNERYLIGRDAAQLALGTGGVLERYDYLKYNTGIIKPNHFLNTETELFYIDHNKKVIDILGEGQQVLSFEKGVNALFRHIYKDKNTLVAIGYDPQYKEVLFTINNNVEAKTLVYSTMTGTFVPCHSTTPEIYINLSKELLSFITSNQNIAVDTNSYIYRHNAGDFGETYSEAGFKLVEDEIVKNIEPSYVSFIVNTKGITVCVFDNVEFNTEVRELTSSEYYTGPFADTTHVEETIDTIEFKNSYQTVSTPVKVKSNTAVLPNASRRIRGWSMAIPLTATSNRFVDTFLSVKMNYNNSTNKLFKLHDVITYIREANK